MRRIDKKLIEKYFRGTCSVQEVKKVFEWFDTPVGQRYLKMRMRSDDKSFSRKMPDQVDQPDSDRILSSIRKEIRKRETGFGRRKDIWKTALKAAATVLVLAMGSLFYLYMESRVVADEESSMIHYVTNEDQQQRITLEDGTRIRLNEESDLWIPGNDSEGIRSVRLNGEAYFDVAHDPDRRFVVETNRSSIQVLGTAFNVKARSIEENVQVAVVQGRVSFSGAHAEPDDTVIMENGEYAYMDLRDRSISVEDFGVENYLSWMRGRLVFENQSLEEVCIQLERMYDLECRFDKESFMDLSLTADFSNDSVDKTLLVIALSLDIGYERDGQQIHWVPRERIFE